MTLWKMTAGGIRPTDELSRPVHPAAYALVTATPVTLPTARTARSRVHALPRQRCLIRLRLMNQPCQRFSGGPQSSRTPGTTLVHVVFLLDPGLVRGYERGSYIAVTGDRASISGAVSPPGAEIERESTSCPGRAPADGERGQDRHVLTWIALLARSEPRKGRRDPDPPSPGRCAPAAGKDPGCPGLTGRPWPRWPGCNPAVISAGCA